KWRAFFRRAVKHQETNMIQLTRLNNHPLVVNSDLIKFVEQAPDTVITLVNGDKIVVRESAQDVLDRVVQSRRSETRQSRKVTHEPCWAFPIPSLASPP